MIFKLTTAPIILLCLLSIDFGLLYFSITQPLYKATLSVFNKNESRYLQNDIYLYYPTFVQYSNDIPVSSNNETYLVYNHFYTQPSKIQQVLETSYNFALITLIIKFIPIFSTIVYMNHVAKRFIDGDFKREDENLILGYDSDDSDSEDYYKKKKKKKKKKSKENQLKKNGSSNEKIYNTKKSTSSWIALLILLFNFMPFLFLLISVLYPLSLPHAFRNTQFSKQLCIDQRSHEYHGLCYSFYGVKLDETIDFKREITWRPTLAWFSLIISLIIESVSVFITIKSILFDPRNESVKSVVKNFFNNNDFNNNNNNNNKKIHNDIENNINSNNNTPNNNNDNIKNVNNVNNVNNINHQNTNNNYNVNNQSNHVNNLNYNNNTTSINNTTQNINNPNQSNNNISNIDNNNDNTNNESNNNKNNNQNGGSEESTPASTPNFLSQPNKTNIVIKI